MEIIVKDLPNFGVIETKLDKHIINNLWDLIDKAKKESKSYNAQLAGNITSSLEINDDNNSLIPILMPMISEYIKRFGEPYHNLIKNFQWIQFGLTFNMKMNSIRSIITLEFSVL